MNDNGPEVLIVGAGPTGLTLACILARQGIRLRIIEASPEPQKGSRGKGLQPRTLELFDDLGIVERVIANGAFDVIRLLYDPSGATTASDEARPPRPDAPYLSPLLIPQWRVEEALRAKLHELGGRVEFAAALSSYAQDEDGVTAQISHGDGAQDAASSDAGPRAEGVRVSWLVGCDGGKSTVRHGAGISFLGETLENVRMMLGDVRLTGLDRKHWHVWRSAEGFLGLCPLPSTDEYQFQASIAPGQEDTPSREAFQRIVDQRTGRKDIRIEEPVWQSMWRANVRMVDRYRDGRVFLAGDAAHVHSPAGGQGMNTGIQDACNLGWKLAASLRGCDPQLLDTYEEERLPIAASVLGLSSKLMQAVIATRTLLARRDDEVLQLGLGYRDRSLSQDLRAPGGGLRAGDRAPDAPGLVGQGAAHMFDLLRGPHVTLLGFGARWRPVLDACTSAFGNGIRAYLIAASAPADFVDEQGHAENAYAHDALFVVRPDNYVGFVTADADANRVLEYLRRIAAPSS